MKITLDLEIMIKKLTLEQELVLAALEDTTKSNGLNLKEIAKGIGLKQTKVKVTLDMYRFVEWIDVKIFNRKYLYYITDIGQLVLNEIDNY